MKSLILIFSMFLSLSNCSNDDTRTLETKIVGTWKLVEVYGSDGGSSPQWTPVNNGYTYTFSNGNNINSNRFTCNGNYQVNSNEVTISFNCNDSQFNQSYNYSFDNGYLILTSNLLYCDEGCSEKYQKITE